jgi:uncharacterized FlaG/YvyC family protein
MADLQLSVVAPVAGAIGTAAPAAAAATGNPGVAAPVPLAAIFPKTPEAAAGTLDGAKSPAAPPADIQVKEAAKEAVKGANAALAASGTLLVFVFDDQAHHMAVKLLDVQTQKVVQQIPLQLMPATASALAGESHSGGLVDTTA